MKQTILIFGFLVVFAKIYGQSFEGEATCSNMYLKMGTQDHLFAPVLQTEYYKSSLHKVKVSDAHDGQMDWKIEDFEKKVGFMKESSKRVDTSYFVTDKSVTYEKDGKTYFKKPDSLTKVSELATPVKKFDLCFSETDTLSYKSLDTAILIAGLKSNVIFVYSGYHVVRQYYYCDSIKLNPKFYDCISENSKFYNMTGGALITQMVSFESEGYDYVYQLKSIKPKKISDDTFAIPKDE